MKLSIYAGPPIQAALAAAGADNRSGRLNTIAERYAAIVARELAALAFSRAEWCAILDALNGAATETNEATIGLWWAVIADTTGLGAKWGVDQQALAAAVRVLPLPAKVAVAEAAERFWARCELGTDAALAAAGITPRG